MAGLTSPVARCGVLLINQSRDEMQSGCALKASSVSQRTMEGERAAVYGRIWAYFVCRGKARIDGLIPINSHAIRSTNLILSPGEVSQPHPGRLFCMLKAPARGRQASQVAPPHTPRCNLKVI